MNKLIMVAGALCLGSTPAVAATTGLYFDLDFGVSLVNDLSKGEFDASLSGSGSIQQSSLDDQGSYWSAAVGYRFSRYFAADVGYIDLGAAKYRAEVTVSGTPLLFKTSIDAGGPAVAAMGILPLGERFELRGRAGVIFAKSTVKIYATDNISNGSDALDENSNNLFAGVGAAFNVTDNFTVHVGAQRFSKVGDEDTIGESDIDVLSLGITFRQ